MTSSQTFHVYSGTNITKTINSSTETTILDLVLERVSLKEFLFNFSSNAVIVTIYLDNSSTPTTTIDLGNFNSSFPPSNFLSDVIGTYSDLFATNNLLRVEFFDSFVKRYIKVKAKHSTSGNLSLTLSAYTLSYNKEIDDLGDNIS